MEVVAVEIGVGVGLGSSRFAFHTFLFWQDALH